MKIRVAHGNKNLMWVKKRLKPGDVYYLKRLVCETHFFFPCIPPPHYYKEKSRTFPGHVTWFNGQILT